MRTRAVAALLCALLVAASSQAFAQSDTAIRPFTINVPDAVLADLKARQVFQNEETGYQQIQGTKPQTLGIALNDSPTGLAAWIVEKFRTWCDCNGDPETVFTKDELLTNITLYWVTETAAIDGCRGRLRGGIDPQITRITQIHLGEMERGARRQRH